MDWSVVINLVVDLLKYSYPFALIFGLTAKFTNFTLSMILDKKIEIQGVLKMKFVVIFFIVSLVACLGVHILAFAAEKVEKKKMEKISKNIKQQLFFVPLGTKTTCFTFSDERRFLC